MAEDAAMPERVGDVLVTATDDDFVATLAVDRPPNSFFDAALIASLADCLDRLGRDGRTRAVVLRSTGKHFCAGAQVGGDGRSQRNEAADLYDHAARLLAGELPVVAAVRGAAIGGGLG